jgi:tetratricopeptide (TPR) repeat protein
MTSRLPSVLRFLLPAALALCPVGQVCAQAGGTQDPSADRGAGPGQGTQPLATRAEGTLSEAVRHALAEGHELLKQADPVAALRAFRSVLPAAVDHPDLQVGMGRAHLLLGDPAVAICYGEAVLLSDPDHQGAMALVVRALQRGRQFKDAERVGRRFMARVAEPSAELLAACASAAFRMQRIQISATLYRRVLQLDPMHAEANLRLGSGLWHATPFGTAQRLALAPAAEAMGRGDWDPAVAHIRELLAGGGVVRADVHHPVTYRLLGEARYWQREAESLACVHPAFARLNRLLSEAPAPDPLIWKAFLPERATLNPTRRAVVDRALAMFSAHLPELVAAGGRQDLLGALERTTDAAERQRLRGRRTFDGRVWDDVRGVGGLHAATGIEALDEAAFAGFDTLVHELAHQVHFHSLDDVHRARIEALYRIAKQEGRCLDYYAAANSAEYFAQGGRGLRVAGQAGRRGAHPRPHPV